MLHLLVFRLDEKAFPARCVRILHLSNWTEPLARKLSDNNKDHKDKMGAGLLPAFIDEDFPGLEDLALTEGSAFVDAVKRSEIKSLVNDLTPECNWMPKGVTVLTVGVFIPISGEQ